jgi:hypothetical protein
MSCSSTCSSSRGPQGDPGQSQYTYIAYASDNAGTGFSLVPDNSLQYLQVLVSNTPIVAPTVANFTGVWVKYIGNNGANGTNGANGSDGAPGDVTFTYNWSSSTTGADPGPGNVKVNDPDVLSATALYIDVEDSLGNNVANVLSEMYLVSTSTVKSIIYIRNTGISNYVAYRVTGGVNLGGYFLINVTPIGATSSTPFSNGDPLLFSFSVTGNKGDTGAEILYNNLTDTASTGSGAFEILMSYSVAANTLSSNGSYLKIVGQGICGNDQVGITDSEYLQLKLTGGLGTQTFQVPFAYQYERAMFEMELHRLNATSTKVVYKTYSAGGSSTGLIQWNAITSTLIPSNDIITVQLGALDIVTAPRAAYIVAQELLIEKHIK